MPKLEALGEVNGLAPGLMDILYLEWGAFGFWNRAYLDSILLYF